MLFVDHLLSSVCIRINPALTFPELLLVVVTCNQDCPAVPFAYLCSTYRGTVGKKEDQAN